jgi:hypothetical protein
MANWIEWNGGECPIKSDKTRVEYEQKNGRIANGYGHYIRWSHDVGNCDIIAYRIIEDHEPMAQTREQITAHIEALQKQLDAMPVVKQVWYRSDGGGFWHSPRFWTNYTFDIETINGIPHINGVAMKEVAK